jgi:hypothetical protein
MMRRARNTIFWPGIVKDVKQLADNCEICQESKPRNCRETLKQHDNGAYPWNKIELDSFTSFAIPDQNIVFRALRIILSYPRCELCNLDFISARNIFGMKIASPLTITLQSVTELILNGWPEDKDRVPNSALPFFNIRDELSVVDGVIVKGEAIFSILNFKKSSVRKIIKRIHVHDTGSLLTIIVVIVAHECSA